MKKQTLLEKKEIRRMSLWLIMSLQGKKQKEERQMLMYAKTLGKSNWVAGSLAKESQLRWWGAPTRTSPLLDVELKIEQIMDQGGS